MVAPPPGPVAPPEAATNAVAEDTAQLFADEPREAVDRLDDEADPAFWWDDDWTPWSRRVPVSTATLLQVGGGVLAAAAIAIHFA